MKSLFSKVVLMIFACFLSPGLSSGAEPGPNRDVIYQVAPIQSLSAGVYDGAYPIASLKQHGDIGIGTFNMLDGEMVCVDGVFYQVKSGGKAAPAPDAALTPFAVVTFFDEDIRVDKISCKDLAGLSAELDKRVPTRNLFYVLRIDGAFDYVKVRSVPPQQKPFKPLVEAVKEQTVFEYKGVEGTLVGLRCPPYTEKVNVPGYHFHFISRDKKSGGHVLDLRFKDLDVRLDSTSVLTLILPEKGDFVNAALGGEEYRDLKKIE